MRLGWCVVIAVARMLALTIVLTGCSATCAPAAWNITFDDDSIENETLAVTVQVRDGTCGSPGAVLATRTFVRGGMRSRFPSLGAGPFALEATALDVSCVVVGRACTDLAASSCLPTIEQTVVAVSHGAPSCAGCRDGVCPEAVDAGVGGDATVLRDGSACGSTETQCDDDVDDDCDGRTDCADADCDGMRGPCGGVCVSGECCDGCISGTTCEQGQSRTACGNGGEACQRCSGSCNCNNDVCHC